jgi:hypothetical protein
MTMKGLETIIITIIICRVIIQRIRAEICGHGIHGGLANLLRGD